MTFSLGNQKKITIKTAVKKAFKKSLFLLFAILFIFSVSITFFNAAIPSKNP